MRMSSVSLINRAFHPHIICTLKLDWLQLARRDWCKSVKFIGKLVFVETGILYVTGLISVCCGSLLRSGMSTQ